MRSCAFFSGHGYACPLQTSETATRAFEREHLKTFHCSLISQHPHAAAKACQVGATAVSHDKNGHYATLGANLLVRDVMLRAEHSAVDWQFSSWLPTPCVSVLRVAHVGECSQARLAPVLLRDVSPCCWSSDNPDEHQRLWFP